MERLRFVGGSPSFGVSVDLGTGAKDNVDTVMKLSFVLCARLGVFGWIRRYIGGLVDTAWGGSFSGEVDS